LAASELAFIQIVYARECVKESLKSDKKQIETNGYKYRDWNSKSGDLIYALLVGQSESDL
jgi:hypothetical protein